MTQHPLPAASADAEPVVDVVVVTHNSGHVIDGLLDSLPQALDGLRPRMVVVDNGSSDDTCEVVTARQDCRLVPSMNRGYAAGINRGVEALGGDGPILVLNPDVRLAPGAVRQLVEALRLPDTGVAAPKVLDEDGSLSFSLRNKPSLRRAIGLNWTRRRSLSEKVADPSAYGEPQIVDWALGAVLLVSRECHDRLGGWDESYFLYSEETDFCLRAQDLGLLTRYQPAAVCTHIGGQSGQSARIHAMQIVNRVRLYRRRHGVVRGWAYYALSVASESSWILRGHPESGTAVRSLLFPRRRPQELGCSDRLLPS